MKKIKKIFPLLLGIMVLMFGTLTVSAAEIEYTPQDQALCQKLMAYAVNNNFPTHSFYTYVERNDGAFVLYNTSGQLAYVNIVNPMLTAHKDVVGWAVMYKDGKITVRYPVGSTMKYNSCLENTKSAFFANYDVKYIGTEDVYFKSKADFFPSLPVALKAVGLPEVIQGQTKVILITAVVCLALLVILSVLPKKLPRFLNR